MVSIHGKPLLIPALASAFTHLQFRRFAGCPVCNLHLRTVAARHDELRFAGIAEVAVFHSEVATMLPFQGQLPFTVIADPSKALYRRFGVESSPRAILDPRAWWSMARGMMARFPSSPIRGEGGHIGLPADFLIDRQGILMARKYGTHADDQWSVEEILRYSADR